MKINIKFITEYLYLSLLYDFVFWFMCVISEIQYRVFGPWHLQGQGNNRLSEKGILPIAAGHGNTIWEGYPTNRSWTWQNYLRVVPCQSQLGMEILSERGTLHIESGHGITILEGYLANRIWAWKYYLTMVSCSLNQNMEIQPDRGTLSHRIWTLIYRMYIMPLCKIVLYITHRYQRYCWIGSSLYQRSFWLCNSSAVVVMQRSRTASCWAGQTVNRVLLGQSTWDATWDACSL